MLIPLKICKNAYGRISMLSKLKFAGISVEPVSKKLCRILQCRVCFGSSLMLEQKTKFVKKNIEKTSLRIILQEMYVEYPEPQ